MYVTVGPYLSVFKGRLAMNCFLVCPSNGMVDSVRGGGGGGLFITF